MLTSVFNCISAGEKVSVVASAGLMCFLLKLWSIYSRSGSWLSLCVLPSPSLSAPSRQSLWMWSLPSLMEAAGVCVGGGGCGTCMRVCIYDKSTVYESILEYMTCHFASIYNMIIFSPSQPMKHKWTDVVSYCTLLSHLRAVLHPCVLFPALQPQRLGWEKPYCCVYVGKSPKQNTCK